MSFFDSIFNVFSRRDQSSTSEEKSLTPEFKERVFDLCRDTFPVTSRGLGGPGVSFWMEVYRKMRYRHGATQLSKHSTSDNPLDELVSFLGECKDEFFLDFIEYVCEADDFWRHADEEEFVDAINTFFRIDDLPYALTPFQREEQKKGNRTVSVLVDKPKVIRRDSQVTHESAVEPALQLLADQRFSSANSEFLEALEDFRHGDYGDCLTKCCSAMESTMKIICDRKGWSYSSRDTAGPLVQTIVSNSNLDGYFDQPILIVATLRNRLSPSHGAGTKKRQVPEHLARYAINATASNILLLVEECI